jgi:uncharacterized membrane protein YdjX (TVP38/TMEM64 family)
MEITSKDGNTFKENHVERQNDSIATVRNIAFFLLAVVGTGLLVWFLFSNELFRQLIARAENSVEENLLISAVVFMLIQSFAVVFILPGLVLTLLAGYLFGPVIGTVVMAFGTTMGASAAFVLGRYCFRTRMEKYMRDNHKVSVLARSVAHDGWKTIMLIRVIPMFPFKVTNYMFGVLPLSLHHFFFGTLIGVLPLTITNVSLGAIAGDLDSLLNGRPEMGVFQYSVIVLGVMSAIVTFFLVRKRAREYFSIEADKQNNDCDSDNPAYVHKTAVNQVPALKQVKGNH